MIIQFDSGVKHERSKVVYVNGKIKGFKGLARLAKNITDIYRLQNEKQKM